MEHLIVTTTLSEELFNSEKFRKEMESYGRLWQYDFAKTVVGILKDIRNFGNEIDNVALSEIPNTGSIPQSFKEAVYKLQNSLQDLTTQCCSASEIEG